MVIKTTFGDGPLCIDDNAILAISRNDKADKSVVYFYGQDKPFLIDMPYEQLEKAFIQAKSRNQMSGMPDQKQTFKQFDLITVGAHKFQFEIRRTEHEDGWNSIILLYTNFPVKNDQLKKLLESVEGVQFFSEYTFDKYQATISIGKLFDAETVRADAEKKLIEFLKA